MLIAIHGSVLKGFFLQVSRGAHIQSTWQPASWVLGHTQRSSQRRNDSQLFTG